MNDFYEPENVEDFGHYPDTGGGVFSVWSGGEKIIGDTYAPGLVLAYLKSGGTITRCNPYTVWAEGSLRFLPGWASTQAPRVLPDELDSTIND